MTLILLEESSATIKNTCFLILQIMLESLFLANFSIMTLVQSWRAVLSPKSRMMPKDTDLACTDKEINHTPTRPNLYLAISVWAQWETTAVPPVTGAAVELAASLTCGQAWRQRAGECTNKGRQTTIHGLGMWLPEWQDSLWVTEACL